MAPVTRGPQAESRGQLPSRRSHVAVLQLRLAQPALYNTGGLLPTNGRAWQHIR